MGNQIVRGGLPVAALDRAVQCYSAVLGEAVIRHGAAGFKLGLLPHAATHVSGCLVPTQDHRPPRRMQADCGAWTRESPHEQTHHHHTGTP